MNENQPVIPNSKSLPLHTRTAHIRRIPLLNHTKPPNGNRKNHCQFIVTKAWHIHRVLKLDRQNQKSLTSDNSSFHRSQKNALQYIQLDIKHFPSVGRASLVNVSLLSPNLRPFFCPYIFFWGGGYMGSKQKQLPNKLRGFEWSSKHLPYLVGEIRFVLPQKHLGESTTSKNNR